MSKSHLTRALAASPSAPQGERPVEWMEDGEWLDTLSQPGPNHERLNALVGEWTVSVKILDGPEQPPQEKQGVATFRWTLGGRFLEETARSVDDTAPFEGRSFIGYNQHTQMYELMWMTNDATGFFLERGRYIPADDVIRLHGKDTDPFTGAQISSTSEIKIDSERRVTVTAHAMGPDGVRWKQLEVVYTRK